MITEGSEVSLNWETLYRHPVGKKVMECIQCGTCTGGCPYGFEMTFGPRKAISYLRAGRIQEVLDDSSAMMCVSCYTCEERCPRGIKLTDVLLPLIKEATLTSVEGPPKEMKTALENMFRYGNPTGDSPKKRALWVKDAGVPVRILKEQPGPVDLLWWVECYPAYHPRGQKVSIALARLLNALKLDFAILGNEEKCAGECARLSGEEGLFDVLTESNLAVLAKYDFKKLLVTGPHAYDAFKYQYPDFRYPMEHYVTWFADRLPALQGLFRKKLNARVTYHDNCCLGRHNGFFEQPRDLLRSIPGVTLLEMERNRADALCCGGGGGGMWLDTFIKEKGGTRLCDLRILEAAATGADTLVVTCPYELSRFEDAVKVQGLEGKLVVKDMIELLAEAMELV
jgi:Fe-S oxidoreductase